MTQLTLFSKPVLRLLNGPLAPPVIENAPLTLMLWIHGAVGNHKPLTPKLATLGESAAKVLDVGTSESVKLAWLRRFARKVCVSWTMTLFTGWSYPAPYPSRLPAGFCGVRKT